MKKFGFIFFLLYSINAYSGVCEGVTRFIDKSQQANLEKKIAHDLSIQRAEIFDSMQLGQWTLVWAETFVSDSGVFFFSGYPGAEKSVATWGGAAAYGEEKSTITWAQANSKGIPLVLAQCFAWRVSPDGREKGGR